MNAGMHLFLCLLLFYESSNAAGLNVCKRQQNDSRNNPVIIYYCCLGYEERDHKCTECSSGFFAVNGTCVPCSKNYYGDRCLELCSCSTQQRCDPVIGCVDMTTVYQKESTVTTDFWKLSTSYLTSKDATVKTERENSSYTGLMIYVVCAACLAFCIGLSVVFRQRLRDCFSQRRTVSVNERVLFRPTNSQDPSHTTDEQNPYDLIDDDNLLDINYLTERNFYNQTDDTNCG